LCWVPGGARILAEPTAQPVRSLRSEKCALLSRCLREGLQRLARRTVGETLVDPRDELTFPHWSPVVTVTTRDPRDCGTNNREPCVQSEVSRKY